MIDRLDLKKKKTKPCYMMITRDKFKYKFKEKSKVNIWKMMQMNKK